MEIQIVALMVLTLAVVVLLLERGEFKRIAIQGRDLIRSTQRRQRRQYKQIVKRLSLSDATFPPIDSGFYSKIIDLYDSNELLPYGTPVEARDRYDMYWTRASFDDHELIVLWLEGVIERPKN